MRLCARLMAELRTRLKTSKRSLARYILWFTTTQLNNERATDKAAVLCPPLENLLKRPPMQSYTVQQWNASISSSMRTESLSLVKTVETGVLQNVG